MSSPESIEHYPHMDTAGQRHEVLSLLGTAFLGGTNSDHIAVAERPDSQADAPGLVPVLGGEYSHYNDRGLIAVTQDVLSTDRFNTDVLYTVYYQAMLKNRPPKSFRGSVYQVCSHQGYGGTGAPGPQEICVEEMRTSSYSYLQMLLRNTVFNDPAHTDRALGLLARQGKIKDNMNRARGFRAFFNLGVTTNKE